MNTMEFKRRYAAIFVITCVHKEIVDSILSKFTQLVNTMNGNVEKTENLGIKPLAYEIKKQSSASYIQSYFYLQDEKILGKNIREIERKFNSSVNQNILRFMIIKTDHSEFNFSSLRSFQGFDQSLKQQRI